MTYEEVHITNKMKADMHATMIGVLMAISTQKMDDKVAASRSITEHDYEWLCNMVAFLHQMLYIRLDADRKDAGDTWPEMLAAMSRAATKAYGPR